jgi:hypothetical protein
MDKASTGSSPSRVVVCNPPPLPALPNNQLLIPHKEAMHFRRVCDVMHQDDVCKHERARSDYMLACLNGSAL